MPNTLKLSRFDPSPFGFPGPRVPLLPNRTIAAREKRSISFGDNPEYTFCSFSRGRYALAAAYRLCGVGPEAALMAPAYHCLSMLDPAVALDAEIILYPLNQDLSPNLSELDKLYNNATHPVRALLATHYFGFAQDFTLLKQWCNAKGILLIEDCSHTLFTEHSKAARIGNYGTYVTASPYKFLVSQDGGLLATPDSMLVANLTTKPSSSVDEAKALKRLVTAKFGYRFLPLQTEPENRTFVTKLSEQAYQTPSRYFVPELAMNSALRSSNWLVRHAPVRSVAAARQANYSRWLDSVSGLPDCRPLYPEMQTDTVPYMFPLVIDNPDRDFFRLKLMGIPIWRWDELAIPLSSPQCSMSSHYQLRLLHLPCHQGLADEQLDWMINTVRHVVQNKRNKGI